MEQKKREIALSNVLIAKKKNYTLYQNRLIYQITEEVRRQFIVEKTGNRTVFQNLYLELTPDKIKECGHVSQVIKEAIELRNTVHYINRDDDEIAVGWLNYIKRNKKSGKYEIEVSKEILPEIISLAEQFTTLDLIVALGLKSAYSQRMYEICNMYKNNPGGYFYLEIEKLIDLIGVPKTYQNYGTLKKRVLEQSRKELKELYEEKLSNLYFEFYENEKTKIQKRVTRIDFYVHTRKAELMEYKPQDAIWFVETYIKPYFPRDKKYIQRIINKIQLRPEISNDIVEKLKEKIAKYKHTGLPAIVRYVLSEDFNIE